MRIKKTVSKNFTNLYIIKDVIINNKRTTKIVEKLGNLESIALRENTDNPLEWANNYLIKLNNEAKSNSETIIRRYSPNKRIELDKQVLYNGGHLFMQDIYYDLGLHKICDKISEKYKFEYDLNNILSNLIYSRVIFPSSKSKTYQLSQNFIDQPNFKLHHVFRALQVICKESNFIQAELYKNSTKAFNRNSKILYYDCTNFFFTISQEDGKKQYGVSKENRPKPIVQMGLFMDGDGIPLAMSINKGNTNEQETLIPLESKILKDFKLSNIVVCTDAGLSSNLNRKFNDTKKRSFITTQSIKKLKKHLKDWALDPDGWILTDSNKMFNINELDEAIYYDRVFYKERWINENGLEQRLIVSYSIKYRNYVRNIRNNQIQRAIKLINDKPKNIGKVRANDYKRFINKLSITKDGEVASFNEYSLKDEQISKEEMYDGFYAVCTNLEDRVEKIVDINKNRWEIEECFKIMKDDFKARPVYLNRDERIEAHFLTCFLSLTLFRYVEKKLDFKYTAPKIIDTLRGFNFEKINGEGYSPLYKRSELTDDLHDAFGFRTDYEIIKNSKIKKIIKKVKTPNKVRKNQ